MNTCTVIYHRNKRKQYGDFKTAMKFVQVGIHNSESLQVVALMDVIVDEWADDIIARAKWVAGLLRSNHEL